MTKLWYLVGFQNRILVFMRWSFSFVTRDRGARLITDFAGASDEDPPAPADRQRRGAGSDGL
jgi:NADH:quinone reductase (non-electrogenic)